MATERVGRVKIEGLSTGLVVYGAHGSEGFGRPFAVEVIAHPAQAPGAPPAIDLDALIGQHAEVALALGDGGERTIYGVVEGAEQRYGELVVSVGPRVARLAQTIDHQVFLGKDAVEIAREVLGEHAIDVAARVSRPLPKRAQCVQAFEDDLAFVSRILADEGIAWFVEHVGGEDVVVLADSAAAYTPIAGDERLRFVPESGLVEDECVFGLRLRNATARDTVRLREYDFEHPLVDLDVEAKDGRGALARFEVGGRYRDPAVGKALANIRLEEARTLRRVLTGSTGCRRVAPGHTFEVFGASRQDLNGRWLLLEVRWELHEGRLRHEERRYQAEFVAVPASSPYRPARPKGPAMSGVQTATVTGAHGTEIHTNTHGQVTALFRWDRRRPKDETSSAWMRPLQPQTGGAMFLPRVGWEAVLGFYGVSGDVPYALGRLDNGAAPPAEGLPAKQVRSAFGSRTTPGGGSANVLRTDDAAGHEDMLLNASSDFNERTETDKTVAVAATDTHSIGANRTQIVGKVQAVQVDGAQTTTVGGSRTANIGGAMMFGLGSESVTVGGARLFEVGGDYSSNVGGALARIVGAAKVEVAIAGHNRHVNGTAAMLVAGSWNEVGGVSSSVSVAGAHLRAIGGPINVRAPKYTLKAMALDESFGSHAMRAGGHVQDKFKGAGSLSVSGSASFKGSKVIVKATTSLTIEAGGLTIQMTPSSIDVKGSFNSGVDIKVTGTDKTG